MLGWRGERRLPGTTRWDGETAMVFCNRIEAGRRLAEGLWAWGPQRPVVMALAPGGAVVATKIADVFGAPLDAVFVHRIAVAGLPCGALGAVGETGARALNTGVADRLGIDRCRLERAAQEAGERAAQARCAHRRHVPEFELGGRTVLLIDDGVATGAAASVAIEVMRERGAGRLVLAVPVGARGALRRVRPKIDALVCVRVMPWPRPVAEWYEDYPEVSDEQARWLLARAARWTPAA